MRADIHDGPEHMLQSEAGYIDARPLTPARQNLLQRTAGPYIRVKPRSLQRLGSCSASSVDVGGSIPSPPTTAGPRHARVSNIWSPAGRSTTRICSDSPHHRGWHICPHNLRLDPHIAARRSLLLPVS